MHRRREDHHVWTKQLLHYCDGDGGCLIHYQELSLAQLGTVLGPNVLYGLSVVPVDVDSHNGVVVVWVGALEHVVVCMLLVVESVQAFEDELKDGLEVLGGGSRHKDIAESVDDGGGDTDAEGC